MRGQKEVMSVCLILPRLFRVPHVYLVESPRILEAPPHILHMVQSIYTLSTCWYGKLHFPLTRGIKEGCPVAPALFMLVYDTFHATLTKEFPEASFFIYVDDIAIVTKNAGDSKRVLKMVQELSLIFGFQTNLGKTEVYR